VSRLIICLSILFVLIGACAEKIKYKDLAYKKSTEMNCTPDIELLVQNEGTELWASYSKSEKGLLCVFICKNNYCSYSTERD
jgi:hypothetical protein